ncbi:autophagy-related protein 13-domain-containing protein [Trametes gibbosa]|nr:autophagy-related protein 13-domain-containing protein [Trametes gibbosa]
MSNDTQRADQIAHKLYSKLVLVVNYARATLEPSPDARLDKWFNLETPDPDLFKEYTRIYRSITSSPNVPLFQLQVLLCVPELATNQVLVYLAPDSSRVRIDPTPRYIVLESWNIEFTPNHARFNDSDDRTDVAPATMYKHGIPLFRSIFTLLRVLPAWKLARRLRRRVGGSRSGFSIQLRVDSVDSSIRADEVMTFDTTPASIAPVLKRERHVLPPITHPVGELGVSAMYLTQPSFQLDTWESLLSSRFLSEGPDFTPTLVKNQQRDSISGSPGSLPLRMSLPRSPPRSVADRFVIAPATHARTTSFSSTQGVRGSPGGSPQLANIPLPVTRNLSGAGMGTSGVSDSFSSRQGGASIGSREDVYTLAARVRRESLQGRSSQDGPTPGGVPIRRTPITTVNAFKSSTISSGSPSLHSQSPSLRQQSPLSAGGPSLPSRPAQSPTASRVPPSPIGAGSNVASAPVTPFRPSPTFAPSSLGSGRSPASGEGVPASPASAGAQGSPRQQGRRYTSSFVPRAQGATGSREASPLSSPRSATKEIDRVPGTSYLGTHTDDDDISAFVQEIDARKPLSSRRDDESPAPSLPPPVPRLARERTIREESESSDHHTPNDGAPQAPAAAARARTVSAPYPMLTTESDVAERLREMNEAFFASLQGIGGRRRESSESPRPDSTPSRDRGSTSRLPPLDPMSYATGGARRDGPLAGPVPRPAPLSLEGLELGAGLPPANYVRPRQGSTGSVRSGFSIASEEIIGRMDPEIGSSSDERRRSALGREYS